MKRLKRDRWRHFSNTCLTSISAFLLFSIKPFIYIYIKKKSTQIKRPMVTMSSAIKRQDVICTMWRTRHEDFSHSKRNNQGAQMRSNYYKEGPLRSSIYVLPRFPFHLSHRRWPCDAPACHNRASPWNLCSSTRSFQPATIVQLLYLSKRTLHPPPAQIYSGLRWLFVFWSFVRTLWSCRSTAQAVLFIWSPQGRPSSGTLSKIFKTPPCTA